MIYNVGARARVCVCVCMSVCKGGAITPMIYNVGNPLSPKP